MRTATFHFRCEAFYFGISILAVLADRDFVRLVLDSKIFYYFNPRGPCGPRLRLGAAPAGRAAISILAVLADRDALRSHGIDLKEIISILAVLADRDFLTAEVPPHDSISILAVLADRDKLSTDFHRKFHISILAVLADRDLQQSL